jgi:hypothetical protein
MISIPFSSIIWLSPFESDTDLRAGISLQTNDTPMKEAALTLPSLTNVYWSMLQLSRSKLYVVVNSLMMNLLVKKQHLLQPRPTVCSLEAPILVEGLQLLHKLLSILSLALTTPV